VTSQLRPVGTNVVATSSSPATPSGFAPASWFHTLNWSVPTRPTATDNAVTPVRASPVGTTDAVASGFSAPLSSIGSDGVPQLGGGAPADDGSGGEDEEARWGQVCSICGYRKRFSHDKHNAGTCGARSLECMSSPTIPVEFRAKHCPCSNTAKKTFPRTAVCVSISYFFCGRDVFFSCLLELVFSRFVVR